MEIAWNVREEATGVKVALNIISHQKQRKGWKAKILFLCAKTRKNRLKAETMKPEAQTFSFDEVSADWTLLAVFSFVSTGIR